MHPIIPNLYAGIVKESLRFRSLFCKKESGPPECINTRNGPDRNHLSERCIMALIRNTGAMRPHQVFSKFDQRSAGGVA